MTEIFESRSGAISLPVLLFGRARAQPSSRGIRQTLDLQWRLRIKARPHPTLDPAGDYLKTIWDQAVYPMAKRRGMTLRLPPLQPRSRRAFELAEFAQTKDRFDEVHRGIYKAFFEDGRNIDGPDTLVEIGTAAGLNGEAVRVALEQGLYRERVIQDGRRRQTSASLQCRRS